MKRKMMLILCVSVFLFGTGLTHQASEAGSKGGITFTEGEPTKSEESKEPPVTEDSKPADKGVTGTSKVADDSQKVVSQSLLPKTNEKSDRSAMAVGTLILLGAAITIKRRKASR